MNIVNILFLIEFASLVLFLARRILSGRNKNAYLIVTTVLCAVQVLVTLTGFIDIRNVGINSFQYKIIFYCYAVDCIVSDFVLVLSAQYLIKICRLQTKMTKISFILFWIFAIADTIIFITNPFTGLAYSGTLTGHLGISAGPLYFYHISGSWMTCHQFFIAILVLLIFVSMLLKCSLIPIVYAGKYIAIGVYFLIISVSGFLQDVKTFYMTAFLVYSILTCGIPLFLYYQVYRYRPRFLLGSIRQMVFDKIGTPIVLFDDENLLIDYNSGAAHLFALEKPLINHLSLTDFLKRSVGNQLRERSTSTVEEVTVKSNSGTDLVFKLDYSKLTDKTGKNLGTLLFFHDITEIKKLYNAMEKTAMTDPLTGLSSKVHLEKKITEINLYRKYPYSAVVCSINGINLIAEGFGEDAGKAATMHVAELLRSQLRASDFAAYDDGNMIVLMPDTEAASAELVFQRISKMLNKDRTFNFSLSFEYGVSSRTGPDIGMQQTVSQAQAAMVSKKMKSDDQVHQSIIASLREALRFSSFETEQHSIRVQNMAERLARKLNLPESELENLRNLALFHDIGKMSVPEEIINKPSGLTVEEQRIMQLHVINGYKIANASKELMPIARGILCHHERWDGNGYPNGYAGEDIPYLSRIVSVADSFDVITHDRPYKVALPVEEAVAEIKRNSGKQFDPAVVNAFLSLDL